MTGRQKRWVGLLSLSLLLVALVVYLGGIDVPDDAVPGSSAPADTLLTADPTRATTVTLATEQGAIVAERRGDREWAIASPVETAADQAEIETMLTRLAGARRERVIVAEPTDLAPFGLDPAALILTYVVDGLDHRVEFGGKSPVGASVYVRVIPADTAVSPVLLVPEWVKKAADKSLYDLRRKELIDPSPGEVTMFELAYADRSMATLRVERRSAGETGKKPLKDESSSGNGWMVVRPRPGPADEAVVDDLIRKLQTLRATAIHDEDSAERLKELRAPRTRVTLQTGAGRQTVSFSLPFGETTAYAVTAHGAVVYEVDRKTVIQFDKVPFDLQDKRLAVFTPDSVVAIDVAGPAGGRRFARIGDGWQADDQPLSAADNENMQRFLDRLHDARVEKIAGRNAADWPIFGLGESAAVVTLWRRDADKAVAEIRLGKREGDLLYVRRGKEMESFIMSAALDDAYRSVAPPHDPSKGPAAESTPLELGS